MRNIVKEPFVRVNLPSYRTKQSDRSRIGLSLVLRYNTGEGLRIEKTFISVYHTYIYRGKGMDKLKVCKFNALS